MAEEDQFRRVLMPDGATLEFPAEMPDDQVRAAILKREASAGTSKLGNYAAEFIKNAVPLTGDLAGTHGVPFVQAMMHPILGTGEPGEDIYQRFEKNLPVRAREAAKFEKENPFASGALNLAGAAAGLTPVAATGVGAKALGIGGKLRADTLRSAATSAAMSGADAAIKGEDPALGAGFGAVLGVTVPAISKVAGATGGSAWDKIATLLGKPSGAPIGSGAAPILKGIDPLALKWGSQAARADRLTDAGVALKGQQLGPEGMALEHGSNLSGLAEALYTKPGEAKTIVGDALFNRARQLPDKVESLLDRTITPSLIPYKGKNLEVADWVREMEKDRATASTPLYKAFESTKIHPTPEIRALTPRLQSVGAFAEAKAKAAAMGRPFDESFFLVGDPKNSPTAESWDYVKRALDDKIAGSKDELGKNTDWTRIYTQLKNQLVESIDKHPDPRVAGVWKKARDTWGSPSEIMSAEREGQNWQSVPYDEIPHLFKGYTPLAQKAYLAGVRRDLANTIEDSMIFNPIEGGTSWGGTKIKELMRPSTVKKLKALVGENNANEIFEEASRQDVFSNTKNRIASNSRTAFRQEAVKQVTPDPEESFLHRMGHRYLPHITPGPWMIPRSLQKNVAATREGEFEAARAALAPGMTKQGTEAEDFVNALRGYTAPVDAATPKIEWLTNVLMHGGVPRVVPSAHHAVAPWLAPFSVLQEPRK